MEIDLKSNFSGNILAMLNFRKSMGFSTKAYIQQFKTFDRYCCECFPDETELNEKVVLGWLRTDIPGVNILNQRASFIRMFGKYLASIGENAYILPDKFVPPQKPYTPYILSDDELKQLFAVIDSYPQNGRLDPLQPALFSIIFRLIYTCGLRPGEARTLRCENINFDTGEITIKETKKHKDRVVVMSDDMIALMKRYSYLRESIHPESPYFFPSKKGVPYEVKMLDWHFRNFIKRLYPDLRDSEIPNIRIYDLRHRFATAVMMKWIHEKRDFYSALPYLSAYMGHAHFSATAYYIHLLPDNLKKSESINWKAMGELIPEVLPWKE